LPPFNPRVKLWLEVGGHYAFGLGICEILQAVEAVGSIKGAAGRLNKSYRHVWARVKEAERTLGRPLVETRVGGKGRQRSSLTPEARRLSANFMTLRSRIFELVQSEFGCLFG
jgi:molybdate transport system regulatory protein